MAYVSFEDLEVWKRSFRLAVEICTMVKDCKEYVLKDQMSRAAISIASNVAEGAERGSKAEFVRFLNIAKGSAAELRTQLYISVRLGSIISEEKATVLISEVKEISNMLQGLIKSQQQ
jgi:four helix bundle protein